MSPRRYNMERRSAAVDETRQRIVKATIATHDAKRSIIETSVEDVARAADVAPATVRRHFRDRDRLVAACGQHVLLNLGLPAASADNELFDGARSEIERLDRLTEALCASYERGESRLTIAQREAAQVPALRTFLGYLDDHRRQLVKAALPGRPDHSVAAATALTGFLVWKAFREAGLSATATQEEMRRVAGCIAAA